MGCASAVNRKDDDDERRIIRLDLQHIKSISTPKNEINLMKLTEQLLKVLEAMCGDNKAKFEKFQDQILNNTNKLDLKIDEVTFLLGVSKEQVLVFQENAQIINLCFDLVTHLAKMLELNQKTFNDKEEWYYRFSYVLIYEISEFRTILSYMLESSTLKSQYQKSKEIVMLYACILGTIRFLEGISWGYSVFLMHQILDNDNVIAVKVMFNQLLRLKQHFKENKDFQNSFQNDKPAHYSSEYQFQSILSYSSLEKIITEVNFKKDDLKQIQSSYLHNQVFRKTYVQVKKSIDEWLRQVKTQEISVTDLKRQSGIKTFTRSYIRDLKNPVKKSTTGELIKQCVPDSLNQSQKSESLILNYSFEIDNSQNIMVLLGNHIDTKVIVESFLQANIKSRTKYKCCILHHCIKENKLTQDSYYIVKNIIFQILKIVPSVRNFIKLTEHDFVNEMMSKFNSDNLEIQKDFPDIFIQFCKMLKQIKLDFNIGIFITGVEMLFKLNRLDNLIYLLRSASFYLPNYFKFIISIDQGLDEKSIENGQKIIKILQTSTIIEINDTETFEKEGKSYLEFAIQFASQPLKSAEDLIVNEEMKEFCINDDSLETSLQKCDGSYRKAVEIIHEIYQIGFNGKDKKVIKDIINTFQFKEEIYIHNIREASSINHQLTQLYLQVLLELKGPINLSTLYKVIFYDQKDSSEEEQLQEIIIKLSDILNINNSQILSINQQATVENYLSNKKTVIVLRNKSLLQKVLHQLDIQHDKSEINDRFFKCYLSIFESLEQEMEFEELDTYFRIHVYKHMSFAPTCSKIFENVGNLFCVKNLFKQILYHRSYGRFRDKLQDIIDGKYIDKDDKNQIIQFKNILFLIEQTIKNEPLNFLDFCTQLRGRILGESLNDFLSDLRLDITSENICFFKNFHHALRENPRIDIILKLPRVTILRIKFMADKKRVVMSLSNGLIVFYNMNDYQVQKIFVNKCVILDQLKIIDDKYLITGGIDPKIRIWNIESEKLISKFAVHSHATVLMICHKEFIFSYGYDMRLAKYNFKNKVLENSIEAESSITAIKLLKTVDEHNKYKVATSSINGNITLYDLQLQILKVVQLKAINEEVIQLINISNTEFLSFTKEGTINIMNNVTLEETKNGSIFNLKSEDYIDLILIKSREYFLFTLEKQKIEFYSATTFKRTDSWDYFFERDLICCDKNKEGSKIFVSDKSGYTTLFNFLKHLDQSKENLVPCNRRYDPVVCIEMTEKLESNQIVSCSQDRDLRVWKRDTGVFIKKYDLSSFTGENITAMKLGKDENMLFLGSKDMNVYLIDISKGKLCVVYEGHWNRVTAIYTIPNKDILITISESNIKVWDLEYDECIKNMNEHNSSIVYISQTPADEEQVMTIGQSFEFKTWNYVTGTVSNSHEIELNKDKKQLKNLNVICCDVMEELAYVALNTNEISVYSIKDNKVLYSFVSYNDEQIIFLSGIKTETANYLLIVTRTACILYLVMKDQVKRLCSYLVNARKKPKKKKHDNKYSYNVRYYFTSARIMNINQNHNVVGNTITTKKLHQNKNQNISNLVSGGTGGQLSSTTGGGGVLDGTSSINNFNVDHSAMMSKEKPEEDAFTNNPNYNHLNTKHMSGPIQTNTKLVDTIGSKIKDTVALVCLGDSRGFVHMNHLYLK